MDGKIKIINELLVNVFNDIVIIEQNALKHEKFKDISITEVHTLEAVGINEPKTMTEIASALKITVGTLTTAINNLVKKGYVERNRSEVDRRVVKISLTEKGKLIYKLHERFHTSMVRSCIKGLTEPQEDILIDSLTRLGNFFKSKYHIEYGGSHE